MNAIRFAALGATLTVLAACGGGDSGPRTCQSVFECYPGEACTAGVCVPVQRRDTVTPPTDTCSGPSCGSTDTREDDGGGGEVCSCAPEDPCTATAPECTGCPSMGSECTADEDCDDGEECTADTCVCGFCERTTATVEGCCLSDADCDDGVACTVDSCRFYRCEHDGPTGCCASAADCDDGDPCTVDACTDELCTHDSLGAGCCFDDADCDDGEYCTTDLCIQGQCSNARDAQYPLCGCANDAMCDDGNACTEDLCEDSVCVYLTARENPTGRTCCETDAECDDEDPSTLERCTANTCFFEPRPECEISDDCLGAYPCYEGATCYAGYCQPTGIRDDDCCLRDSDCDDGDYCTDDVCLPVLRCRHDLQLHPGCCSNDAHCSDALDCTHNEECCNSDQCCAGGDCVPRGHCTVTIQAGEGCCGSDLQCDDGLPCTFDVCANGACHNLDTGEACCQADADCDDGDLCTTDLCESANCFHEPIDGCCSDDAGCDDDDICTTDRCEGNACLHERDPSCCHEGTDCDDGDMCTVDTCNLDSGVCEHQRRNPCCEVDADCDDGDPCHAAFCTEAGDCRWLPVDGCCHGASDCDDGDPCTLESCFANTCQYAQSSAPECCDTVEFWAQDFAAGPIAFDLDGWDIQNQDFGHGWQIDSAGQSRSRPYSLYYGNSGTHTYANGHSNAGTARGPYVTLTGEGELFANFWVWIDVTSIPAGQFEVQVAPDSHTETPVVIFDATEVGGDTHGDFHFVSADLSPWRGRTVRLEFYFRSDVASTVGPEGVYVDDIVVGGGCYVSPVECQSDFDCVDDDPCTDAVCDGTSQSCVTFDVEGPSCCDTRAFATTFDLPGTQAFHSGTVSDASDRFGWAPSDARAASPPASLYFGDPDRACPDSPGDVCPSYGDDSVSQRAAGWAESEPIALSSLDAPLLSFDLWAEIDPLLIGDPDRLDVVLTTLSNGAEATIWSSLGAGLTSTGGEFQEIVVDLGPWGDAGAVSIRFEFFTSDAWGYAEGVYIDNVTVGERCD